MMNDILPSGAPADKTETEPADNQAKPASEKNSSGSPQTAAGLNKSNRLSKLLDPVRRLSPRQRLLVAGALVLGLIVAGGLIFMLTRHKPAPAPVVQKIQPKPVEAPKPTTEPSRLSGLPVAPELNKRPVTGVMIENSPDARPQAGLKDAGIVFEAIAEGGITRFLALFEESQPDYIGPVRSVRPYYLDWLAPFDAGVAHVGGSPEALAQIRAGGIKDLDQFFNASAYHRVSSRFAPHNMYTSMANLDALNQQKGFTASTFTSFARKTEAPSKQVTARTVDIGISSFLYNVHYDYDAASNTYKRSEGGKPHLDDKSAAQLAPKVVVALIINKGIESDGLHSEYATSGSGQMFVFQDGTVSSGNWQKTDRKSQFVLTDSAGAPFKFNPGQTWFTAVNAANLVSYHP